MYRGGQQWGDGGGDRGRMEYTAWDKTLVDSDYLEELVKNKLISESATPKQVWMEHPRFQKYSLVSFQSALNKVKNKYQFHMRLPTKKPTPKVNVKVIKKGPPVDSLMSSLFSMMDAGMKDEGKGTFWGSVCVCLIFAWWF